MSRDLTLLACYAHPDDESYGAGGAIAKYADEGARCHIVTVTSGEVGLDHRDDDNGLELADHRVEELKCAAKTLGAEPPTVLGYPDGGVDSLAPGELANHLAEVFTSLEPDAVLTFDKTGVTGHADHMAVHYAVTDAFERANLAESRLFYSLLPRRELGGWQSALEELGIESPFGDFPVWDGSPVPPDGSGGPRVCPDDWITTTIDVSGQAIRKRDAILCHHSQMGPEAAFAHMPDAIVTRFFGTEYYMLGAGDPDGTESDLFGRS